MTAVLVLQIVHEGSERVREVPIAPAEVEEARAWVADRRRRLESLRDGRVRCDIVPVSVAS